MTSFARIATILALGTLAAIVPSTASAAPTLGFSPMIPAVAGDTLDVRVDITSTYELASVVAVVDTASAPLTFAGSGTWSGTVPLSGLTWGSKTITITATDVLGGTGVLTATFLHDRPPTLTVTAPVAAWSLARPSLRVKAACADDAPSPCQIQVLLASLGPVCCKASDPELASAYGAMDQDVSFATASRTNYALMHIRATDSSGQHADLLQTVIVEDTPGLVAELVLPGWIQAFDAGRVVWIDDSERVFLRDRKTGLDAFIASEPITGHFITPDGYSSKGGGGAPVGSISRAWTHLFSKGVFLTTTYNVYEHVGGATTLLDRASYFPVYGNTQFFAGDFRRWTQANPSTGGAGGNVMLRNLGTGTETVVGSSAPGGVEWSGLLTASGSFLFPIDDGATTRIARRSSTGVVTTLATGLPAGGRSLQGDDLGVVVETWSATGGSGLHHVDGSGAVTTLVSYPTSTTLDRAAAGGWAAFSRLGPTGVRQVWRRAPSGLQDQVSFFGSPSLAEAIAPNGEVVFVNDGRRYIGRPAVALPILLSGSMGRVEWRDGAWHVVVGRSILTQDCGSDAGGCSDGGADGGFDGGADAATDASSDVTDAALEVDSDATVVDTTVLDTALVDSVADTGVLDTAVLDTAVLDTAVLDTEALDTLDSGTLDTGVPDSPARDTGVSDDAAADAAPADTGPLPLDEVAAGEGCSTGPGPARPSVAVLLVLLALRRGRRQQSKR